MAVSLLPRPPLHSRLAVLAALVLVGLGGSAVPAGAADPADHVVPAYGVGALRAEWLADFPLGLEDLARMGQARIGLYRARFREDQAGVDGSYTNWSGLDNLARAAALNGVTLQAVLINMPLDVYTPARTGLGGLERAQRRAVLGSPQPGPVRRAAA